MSERSRKIGENIKVGFWPPLVALGIAMSGWRAERNYRSLPQVLPDAHPHPPACDGSESGGAWPGVSVIVPARNEQSNLPRLLDSLTKQDYPLYEIIVVDDASTDNTAAIVRRYADCGVRLIESAGPPTGWTGKNSACWLGAGQSRYPWLLFIDADVALEPLAMRSALAFALKQGAGALSLFTRQECKTFWERLLLPFAYQQYFVGVNARRMHGEHGPALANGQFFLISRAAYDAAGGHAANAHSIIDDVALATRLKQVGTVPLACRGEQLVSVRMYSSLRAIIEGFGKNSFLFLRQSPATGAQSALSTTLAASVLMLLPGAFRRRSRPLLLIAGMAYLAQMGQMRSWTRRFGVSSRYLPLAPLAAMGFLGIALNSMARVVTGRSLAWRGRSYRARPDEQVRFRYPLPWVMEMGRALLFKTPRSIIEDSQLVVRLLSPRPFIEGEEHIPREGSFVLISNHYQRSNLWIGLSGAVLIDTIARKRPFVMHYVTTDRARIGRFTVPGSRWLIDRVATVWDLVLVTPPAIADARDGQRYTLLRMLRLLKKTPDQVCIALMPEGDEGGTSGLIEAVPGSGRALYALSSKGLPILPAAVSEEAGRFRVCFGEPFSLKDVPSGVDNDRLDAWARHTVMRHIAELLPPRLRGRFGRELHGALG